MTVQTNKSLMDLHPRELKGVVEDIPTLPVIYRKLFAKMQDPDVDLPEIAGIISADQALAAKVLNLVNSALYDYSKQIETISRAVVILGFKAVRSATLAISVLDYFQGEEPAEQLDMRKFWEHSIATAAISRVLAGAYSQQQQEEAFIVGLLHDVGRLIEKRHFAEDFDEVCTFAAQQHLSWYECEKQLFNLNHAGIGSSLFRAWNFPPGVVEAVGNHHAPDTATAHTQLASLVHVADFMAYELGFGAPGAYPPPHCDRAALSLLGVVPEQLVVLRGRIDEEISNSLEILKLVE